VTFSTKETTTLLAILEWAKGQKDLFEKLKKTSIVRHVQQREAEDGRRVKKSDLLTRDVFRSSVRNTLADAERLPDRSMILQWIATGNLSGESIFVEDLLHEAGDILDTEYAADIIGRNLFLGGDGKYYSIVVEAIVSEVNEDFAADVIADAEAPIAPTSEAGATAT
jgi:hypothetical protein